jgi:hypothetical protein
MTSNKINLPLGMWIDFFGGKYLNINIGLELVRPRAWSEATERLPDTVRTKQNYAI